MPFSDKQIEYFENANHRWNFKVGATRAGKTYMDYYLIPKRIRSRVGKEGLAVILGVTKSTIERNVLEPMRNIWGDELVGGISSDNTSRLFGEKIYCLGAEKVSQVTKIRGASFKYVYGDEVAEWNEQIFELLKSRMDKPYSVFDGTLNPGDPKHWLKKFLESDADIYEQKYTIFDNPFLDPAFVSGLCKEYEGTVYYPRYILGEWTRAEGLVYPMFEKVITNELPEKFTDYCMSIDYGTQNAFAAILWGYADNVWYAFREYYYSGRDTGRQKADDEYAEDIDVFTGFLFEEDEKGKSIMMGGKLETIIDPSAASFIAMLKKRGRYKVRGANNDVRNGIRETATAINLGRIKVHSSLENWKKEAAGYTWDEKKEDEAPIKVNDHLMDSMRYFCKTKRVAKAKRINDGNVSGLEFL